MQIHSLTEQRSSLADLQITRQPPVTDNNLLALPMLVALLILLFRSSRYFAYSCYVRWHDRRRAYRLIMYLQQITILERIFIQSP